MSPATTRRAMTTNETFPFWQPFVEGLRAFVARRVPPADAEDVAQDVLLRLHRGASQLRDESKAQGWVYGVARHVIADYYRARRPATTGGETDLEAIPDPRPGIQKGFGWFPGEHSAHEEVLTWLRPIAEELPAKYRSAVLMADFEGRTQREVAEALGLTLSGAKSRVQRGRRMIAESLSRCCQVEIGPDGRVEDFKRRECDC